MKILMVCLGNICRSPLAEGLLTEKFRNHAIAGFVDSAGTGAWHIGQPPDLRSISIARKHGIDISGQRARKISIIDFEKFDLILTMDKEVLNDVVDLAETIIQKKKVTLLLEYAGIFRQDGVPDPYTGGMKEFEQVYHLLDEACSAVLKKLHGKEL